MGIKKKILPLIILAFFVDSTNAFSISFDKEAFMAGLTLSQKNQNKKNSSLQDSFTKRVTTRVDFIVFFDSCKATLSSAILNNESPVRTADGDSFVLQCERDKTQAKCDYFTTKAQLFNSRNFEILSELNGEIDLSSKYGADYLLISYKRGVALINSRILIEEKDGSPLTLGSKICQGVYMNQNEFDSFSKKFGKTK